MEYPYIDLIPAIIKSHMPSVYEGESFTSLEYVSKVSHKMNEVVDEFNSFVKSVCDEVDTYKNCTDKDIDLFKRTIEQKFADFVSVITLKYQSQDNEIKKGIEEMIAVLPQKMEEAINNMYSNGEFDLIVYRSIENLKNDFDNIVNNSNTFQNNINNAFANTLTDIETFKNEINTSFGNLESHIEEKFDSLQFEAQVADMQKAVYDSNDDGVVDNSDKLGGYEPSYYAKKQELDTTNSNVSSLNTIINSLNTQMSTVQNTANSAKTLAEEANSNSTNVNERINNAVSLANIAQSSADSAQSSADSAQSSADSAQNTANKAVKKSGDTMTGKLTLSGDPTNDLHAATKQYVDNKVQKVTIWSNSSSSVNFSAKSISPSNYNREDYAFFIVRYKYSTSNSSELAQIVMPTGYSYQMYMTTDISSGSGLPRIHVRSVNFKSDNTIVFNDAYANYTDETESNTVNSYLIPYTIYGIKM